MLWAAGLGVNPPSSLPSFPYIVVKNTQVRKEEEEGEGGGEDTHKNQPPAALKKRKDGKMASSPPPGWVEVTSGREATREKVYVSVPLL